MKTILTLSAFALLSVSVFAQNSNSCQRRELSRPFYMQRQASSIEKKAEPIQLKGMKTITAMPEKAAGSIKAPQTTYGAYYGFGDGTYHCSLIWDGGWYGYNYALALGFPYASKFTGILGNEWSMVTPSKDVDLNEYVDANGDLVLSDLGIGEYYMPTISSGKQSYLYGASAQGQILIQADQTEEMMPFAKFDANESEGFYGGINTGTSSGYAYGSSTPYGTSGYTEIRFGNVGGPLMVESLKMWLYSQDVMFATEDDYILVSLIDVVGDSKIVYTAKVTEENIEEVNGNFCATATFTEEDEDGFESEITPVLLGDVTVVIENTPGCDYGIIMASSNVEDVDKNGRSIYPGSSYWYHDGSMMEESLYSWQGGDAVVYLSALYNALCEFGTGETVFNVTAPAAVGEDGYAWVVSAVQDGQEYNDFDLESTFAFDEWNFEYDEEVVAGFAVDSTYLDQYGFYALFVGLKGLPEGIEGRTTTVKVTSAESATVTINITQGVAGENGIAGLKGEAVDPKQIYNLMGQKVLNANAAGLYIQNGKKTLVK